MKSQVYWDDTAAPCTTTTCSAAAASSYETLVADTLSGLIEPPHQQLPPSVVPCFRSVPSQPVAAPAAKYENVLTGENTLHMQIKEQPMAEKQKKKKKQKQVPPSQQQQQQQAQVVKLQHKQPIVLLTPLTMKEIARINSKKRTKSRTHHVTEMLKKALLTMRVETTEAGTQTDDTVTLSHEQISAWDLELRRSAKFMSNYYSSWCEITRPFSS